MNQEDNRTTKDDFFKKSMPVFLILGILFGIGILGVWITPEIKIVEKQPESLPLPYEEDIPLPYEENISPLPEPEVMSPPPVEQKTSVPKPFTQFGTLISLTSIDLRIRQTAGYYMMYAVDADTQYYRCDLEIPAGGLASGQNVIVAYTLPGDNTRKAIAVYLTKDCGADTVPASFARERYLSHFGSEYLRIVSGTVQNNGSGRFDVVQTSGESSSFSYGVDTVFYRCGSPSEFRLSNGQTVSVAFIPGLEARNNIIYVAGVDLRDGCQN